MLCLVNTPSGLCTAHASVDHFNGDEDERFGVSCPKHVDTPRILESTGNENAEYQTQYAYACGYYD